MFLNSTCFSTHVIICSIYSLKCMPSTKSKCLPIFSRVLVMVSCSCEGSLVIQAQVLQHRLVRTYSRVPLHAWCFSLPLLLSL